MKWIKNKTLKRLWFKKNPLMGLYWVLGWISSLSTFFLSLMVGSFFDLYYQEGISKTFLLERLGIRITEIHFFFILFFVVVSFKFGIELYERTAVNFAAERLVSKLTAELFSKQITWSNELFSEVAFGKYLLRYSGDMQSIRNMLVNGIFRGVRDALFLITGISLLIWLNLNWTLMLVCLTLMAFPVFLWVDQRQYPLIREKRNSKSNLINFVTESFSQHTSIKMQQRTTSTIRRFQRRNSRVLKANLHYRKSESLRQSLVVILSPLLIFALLLLIYYFSDTSTPGEALAFLLVLSALTPAIRNVIKAPNTIDKGMLSLQKVEFLLNKKEKKHANPTSESKLIPLSKKA